MIKFRRLTDAEWLNVRCDRKKVFSIAAVMNDKLAGYLVYKNYKTRICILEMEILNPLVAEPLLDRIAYKLGESGKLTLEYVVPEKNLEMLKFLSKEGFVATQVLRNFFEESGEDGFKMEFSIENSEKVACE